MPKKLTVVLPTYNERENLPLAVDQIMQHYGTEGLEVIVVDDDSPDKTWEVAENLPYPWLKVIRRVHEKGLSSAVMAGFAAASGDYLVVMDADLQHDTAVIRSFVNELDKGAEIVVGSRKVDGGGIENWSFSRKVISGVATRISKFLLPLDVTDPMSGFFGLKREVYLRHGAEINPLGWKILLEFLWRARGVKVTEVGYIFRDRQFGKSKLSQAAVFDLLEALFELRFGQVVSVRFLNYAVVGLSGVAVSQFFLWLGRTVLHLSDWWALALGIEVSIVSNFAFNNVWTFRSAPLSGLRALARGFLTFNAICLAGAVINHAVAMFVIERGWANIYFANLLGIIFATFWNYFVNTNITWRKK